MDSSARCLWFKRSIVVAAVLVAVFASGCGRPEPGATPVAEGKPTAQEEIKTFTMNVIVSGVPFWADTRATWGAIGQARDDVKTVFGGPLDTDEQKQIDEIEALLAQGVDGLVVAPANSASLAPIIDRAVDSGIPVVTYLVDAPASKRLTYIASELEGASLKIGRFATGGDGGPAKAVILFAEAGNAEQEARRRGFEMLAEEKPGLEIVEVIEDKYDEARGAELMRALLAKHPDLRFAFGCNSRSAVGVVSALREMGSSAGSVVVTGWDTDKDVLDLIGQGWVKASAAQQSSFMTAISFAILDAHVKGVLYPQNRRYEENGIRPLPEEIVIPIQIVTSENVAGFYPR